MKDLISITTKIFFALLVMMTLSFSGIAVAQDEESGTTLTTTQWEDILAKVESGEHVKIEGGVDYSAVPTISTSEPENIEYSTLTADDGTKFILKTYRITTTVRLPAYYNSNSYRITEYISEIFCECDTDTEIWQHKYSLSSDMFFYNKNSEFTQETIIEKEKDYTDFTAYRVTVLQYPPVMLLPTIHIDDNGDYIRKYDVYCKVSAKLLWIDKENHKYCGSFNEDPEKMKDYHNDPEYYNIFKEMYVDVLDSHIKKCKEYMTGEKWFDIDKDVHLAMICILKFDEELGEKYDQELLSYVRENDLKSYIQYRTFLRSK